MASVLLLAFAFVQLLFVHSASPSALPHAGQLAADELLLEDSARHVVEYWRSLRHAEKVGLLALTLQLPRAHHALGQSTAAEALEATFNENLRARLTCPSTSSQSSSDVRAVDVRAVDVGSLKASVQNWPASVAPVRDTLVSALALLSTYFSPYVPPPSPSPSASATSTPSSTTAHVPACNVVVSAAALGSGALASPAWLAMAPVALCLLAVAALGGWGMSLKIWCRSRAETRALRRLLASQQQLLSAGAGATSDYVELLPRATPQHSARAGIDCDADAKSVLVVAGAGAQLPQPQEGDEEDEEQQVRFGALGSNVSTFV